MLVKSQQTVEDQIINTVALQIIEHLCHTHVIFDSLKYVKIGVVVLVVVSGSHFGISSLLKSVPHMQLPHLFASLYPSFFFFFVVF